MFSILETFFPQKVKEDTVQLLIVCLDGIEDERLAMAIPQLDAGLLRYWRETNSPEPHFIRFTYFPSVSGRFEDPMGRYFRVRNIFVGNQSRDKKAEISIYFSRGLICGYCLGTEAHFEPDLGSIDNSRAEIELLDTLESNVSELFSSSELKLVNPSDVYEVVIDGKVYFHVKDIGDGDFIGIDEQRRTFVIKHDPFQIEESPQPLEELLTHTAI